MPSRFVQQISRRCQIPIGVADPGMSQIAGKNGHPADCASFAPLPTKEDATGEGMPQIMQADVPPVGVRNEALSQLTKHRADSCASKASTAIRNKEVLCAWEEFLPLSDIVLERWQGGWV